MSDATSAAIATVSTEIARTDTKAGLLLTLNGLLVAGLSLQDSPTSSGPVALVLTLVAAAAVAGSVSLALGVIRPRLGTPGRDSDPSFVTWAVATPDQITESLTGDHRITRISVLSRIAMRKMQTLRWSADAALVAVVATAAALIAS